MTNETGYAGHVDPRMDSVRAVVQDVQNSEAESFEDEDMAEILDETASYKEDEALGYEEGPDDEMIEECARRNAA